MTVDIKLINKYIKRIKIDYPEDDKLMIDLQQFAHEVVENCSIPNVVNRRRLLLDFADYSENDKTSQATDECVDNYLDSIK